MQCKRFVWFDINSYYFFSGVIEKHDPIWNSFLSLSSEISPDLSTLLTVKVGAVLEGKNALIFLHYILKKLWCTRRD